MLDLLNPLGLESRHIPTLFKLAIAAIGSGLIASGAFAARRGRAPSAGSKTDTLLVVLAVAAFVSWWHVGGTHFGRAFHTWEFFHYYLGAKYSPELEYTRLYECTGAAEAEVNPSTDVWFRWTRNLQTNLMEQGTAAARNPELCRGRFTAERWAEFKHDVLFFRDHTVPLNWGRMQMDHGYNATPVWNIAGYLLSNTGPASRTQMIAIALIDPILIVCMWLLVWRAFGTRTTAIAIIFWGTNYPARYFFLGAAFLRSDWLVLAVSGIALAKLGYMTLAGGALGWSTLLRIFPGFLTGGAALRFLRRPSWRDAEGKEARRLITGACLAIALLVTLSVLIPPTGPREGASRWTEFVENSRKHLSGSSVNRVGLRMLAAYSPESQYGSLSDFWIDTPGDAWQTVRARTFQERRALYWLVVFVFVALLALAVDRQPYWVAFTLGVGLIPMVADITCYYYGVLLVYAFLTPRHPWVGAGLLALSAFTLVAAPLTRTEEVRYTVISAGVVAYVFAVTAALAWSARKARRGIRAPHEAAA